MIGRLGIVGFFGILVPGAYLSGSLLVLALSISPDSVGKILKDFSTNAQVAFSSSFLLISYLLGVILRLIGPNVIDRGSTFYYEFMPEKIRQLTAARQDLSPTGNWWREPFPYKGSVASALEKSGLYHVVESMSTLNPSYADSNNTLYFNYCKAVVQANNKDLGLQLQQAEAMVRFLAGTGLALGLSILVWAPASLLMILCLKFYPFVIVAISFALFLPIIHWFKFQRRREVILTWNSVHLLLTEAVPSEAKVSVRSLNQKVAVSRQRPRKPN